MRWIDHGDPTPRLEENLEQVRAVLRELGISLDAVSQRLEEEAVKKFTGPFDHLHAELRRKLATRPTAWALRGRCCSGSNCSSRAISSEPSSSLQYSRIWACSPR